MEKINVNLYGGKSIFGGRETPLEAEITYCEKYKECSFYKKGKCYSAGRLGPNCKFGQKTKVRGYTSRAIKYSSFRNKYVNDDSYNKLKEPNGIVGKIGNMYILNTSYLSKDKENGNYYIDTNMHSSLIYIEEPKFTNDLIKMICDARPKTIMWYEEIKSYQKEFVPRFLYELKTEFKDRYKEFIKEYPEYKERKMNFVGRYAYISTLKEGTELIDCHNNVWQIRKDEIVCDKWKTWLPFGSTPTKTRIKITNDMAYKITNNNQVDKNTKFKD